MALDTCPYLMHTNLILLSPHIYFENVKKYTEKFTPNINGILVVYGL